MSDKLIEEAKAYLGECRDIMRMCGLRASHDLFKRISKLIKAIDTETPETGGEEEYLIMKYFRRDIEHISIDDISVLYRYMRRYITAEIPGIEDHLAFMLFKDDSSLTPEPKEDIEGDACERTEYGTVFSGERTSDGRLLIGFDLGHVESHVQMGNKWKLSRLTKQLKEGK